MPSNKRVRQFVRIAHLVLGISLILYIYTPLKENAGFSFFVTGIAIPLTSLSGILLWQQPKILKLFRKQA